MATLYCPTCGCNLTGLPENRCPKCGNRIETPSPTKQVSDLHPVTLVAGTVRIAGFGVGSWVATAACAVLMAFPPLLAVFVVLVVAVACINAYDIVRGLAVYRVLQRVRAEYGSGESPVEVRVTPSIFWTVVLTIVQLALWILIPLCAFAPVLQY